MPLVAVVLLLAAGDSAADILFRDRFSGPRLGDQWVKTKAGDFAEETVEVDGGRLRLAASTLGTDDRTVKYHGVRTREAIAALERRMRLEVDLDWGSQANGCYMTCGLYLCPTAAQNPRDEPDWLRVEYVGVPPGLKARCQVTICTAGQPRDLYTEGWPEKREGRTIGRQRLRIELCGQTLRLEENGILLCGASEVKLRFTRAYVYLQQSSHSNYPLREVFFDNLRIDQDPRPTAPAPE
ncbi:MAG: hypothetical protein ABFE16_12075 [Armatimonadia bacterium]